MGEQYQRLGSGESESFTRSRPCIGASGEAENFLVEGCLPSTMRVGLRPYPSARVSGESEMFQDPLCEASNDVERWAGTLTQLAGGPARGELACGSP
jgi:hypothetical protein